jgi:hypothetical protein
MVSKNCLLLFAVALLSVSRVTATDEDELKERWFDNCLLREVDGQIWLQKPMVHLGMCGVMATPPFCLSEDLATRFAPLVSNVTSGDEQSARHFYSSDQILREQKGHLILVSMKAEMRPVYDKRSEEVDRTRRAARPEYYEVVKARMLSAEFLSVDWIEAWRRVDEALKEIVSESLTAPGKEKRRHLAAAVEKGSSALNAMVQAKPSDDFQVLVGKVDPDARLVRIFARGVTYQWQEWLERFAARLVIKLKSPLPAKPKLWLALEVLANSESLPDFRVAKEKIPLEHLELLYGFDLGEKLRALETGQQKDYKFETLRDSAKKLLPEVRAREERLDSPTEASQKETIEEFGLVLRPASAELLAKNLILSGIKVESISAEQKGIGLRAGDVIIDYDRVYGVVMGWYSFNQRTRELANRMKRGYKPRIIRDNQTINLGTE